MWEQNTDIFIQAMSQKFTSNTLVLESHGRITSSNQGSKHRNHGFWCKGKTLGW